MSDTDEVIEEIRRARYEISRQYKHDVYAYVRHLMRLEAQASKKVRRHGKTQPRAGKAGPTTAVAR